MKIIILSMIINIIGCSVALSANNHADLVTLFKDWRSFETPPIRHGAPDYTVGTFDKRYPIFKTYQKRLNDFDISSWPVVDQVDWHVIRAEMNGFDFNHRILKPWVRDPAYYKSLWTAKSDVPAHEGPTHHAVIELWTYSFPLSSAEEKRLTKELGIIPPLMKQAQMNLTGNARDLWITGIRDIREQSENLEILQETIGNNASDELKAIVASSKTSTYELVNWLETEAASKTGPSGLGKENYTWYQKNVHLVPMTWDDEVMLLRHELERAWAELKQEEHRNRNVPAQVAVSSAEEYQAMAERDVEMMISFLRDQDIVTVPDYFEPALRAHVGSFVPEGKRNFFSISMHYDLKPLFSHFYHWFELARMEFDPHPNPIRRNALLYNIFDSRNEGTATAVEEIFMNSGLYDDNPHSRENVLILVAQRAARGLGSLYAHSNEMTMSEAGGIHANWTPRGWMKMEPELQIFEQHLYLRQPGYGTSYITGKYLLERAMADYAKMQEEDGKDFKMKEFFDNLSAIGNIPISLGRWQMTGMDDDIKSMTNP
ncbi:MAG: hypothetical protein HOH19_07795 [Kordiimonadaceae bacterium]|nr:hypothetical protein [Kordiimonadaceae bacterium]MBT6032462.1 hypothetical protein [Kordiimonadaceae bacterium]